VLYRKHTKKKRRNATKQGFLLKFKLNRGHNYDKISRVMNFVMIIGIVMSDNYVSKSSTLNGYRENVNLDKTLNKMSACPTTYPRGPFK
jgi:hypothetical protein